MIKKTNLYIKVTKSKVFSNFRLFIIYRNFALPLTPCNTYHRQKKRGGGGIRDELTFRKKRVRDKVIFRERGGMSRSQIHKKRKKN